MNAMAQGMITAFERESIVRIVERSAFLNERLGPDFCVEETLSANEEELGRQFESWKRVAALGEDEQFAKRLSWDGLTREKALAVLRGVRFRQDASLPAWAECLQEVGASVQEFVGTSRERLRNSAPYLSADDPIPFEEAIVPFINYWTKSVRSANPAAYGLLMDEARRCLQRTLLNKLSQAAAGTLMVEFSTFSASAAAPADQTSDYDAFVESLYSSGFWSLFESYPVLGRLLAETTELYKAFISKFLVHLTEDLPSLQQELANGQALRKITRIETGLSDTHAGGTSVLGLTFESGVGCFYKPKNIDSEKAYYTFLSYLNERGATPYFRIVTTVTRKDHGWAEAVKPEPCPDESAVNRYFERAGMMLCVLYVLGANDCNVENIIPAGEQPVLIDAETLFQPTPSPLDADTWAAVSVTDRAMFSNSVLRVGMLPRWRSGPDGTKNDINGLGGVEGMRGHVSRKIWENINTDSMSYSWKDVPIPSQPVMLRDKPVYAADFAGALEAGFVRSYELFCKLRDELLRSEGPLAGMKSLNLRFLVRSTYIYYGVMYKLLLPQHQGDGMSASIQVDALARRFVHSDERPRGWPIVKAETNSIVQMDIPRFSITPCNDSLQIGPDEHLTQFFVEPSFDAVMQRIASLGTSDLDLQVSFIRNSFAPPYQSSVLESSAQQPIEDEEPLTFSEALQEAHSVAEQIKKIAFHGKDGTVCWITHGYNADSQFWQIQPMGLRLFDGVCGTALFLAAVGRAADDRSLHDLSAATFNMISRMPAGALRAWTVQNGIGATLGISSIIYTLLQAARFLPDDSLTAVAQKLVEHITEDVIANDKKIDILGGAAGCIVVLLRVYEATLNACALQTAVLCGNYLLGRRIEATPGLRSWSTIQRKCLAGFSHGAAGIAYALIRLAQVSGEGRFFDAAVEALEYETTLFDKSECNWPNLLVKRKDGGYAFWNSWCHGAPGIGLSRLGMLNVLDTPSVRQDIAYALQSASAAVLNSLDNLCCGTLGRLEVLLEAHRVIGSEEALKKAKSIARQVMRQSQQRGNYRVGSQTDVYVPSFHQGMAGVGYQLLRIANPSSYPSILGFQ